MAYSAGWKPGRWSAICDRCGFRFHSDKLKKEWDGLMICHPCWETRHPQDFLKVPPERIVPPWTRTEPDDVIELVCWLYSLSAYTDLAEADCTRADAVDLPYDFLFDLKGGPIEVMDVVPPTPTPPPTGGGLLYLDGDSILLDDAYIEFSENAQIFLDLDFILLDSNYIGFQ